MLAVRVKGISTPATLFISIRQAVVLGMFMDADQPPADNLFALSRNGHWFARRVNYQQVEVREVPGDRPPIFVSSKEDVWTHIVKLGRSCILVKGFEDLGSQRNSSVCLIRWDRGRLEVVHRDALRIFEELGRVVAQSRVTKPHRSDPNRDSTRFVTVVEHKEMRILVDRYNHLVVSKRTGDLVAMFFLSRGEFAAWMPNGTRLGSLRLNGSAPTPGGEERFASALRAVEQLES